MEDQFLMEQIDYVKARIEAIDEALINSSPSDKGYKELIESYNKWVDRYNELLDEPKHRSDVDLNFAKLEIESDRLQSESEIEMEKIALDREKFEYEKEHQKKRELIDDIFEGIGAAGKILVPVASLVGVVYVANLAYMNDSKLELCNGRVFGTAKDLFKVLTLKA